MSIDNSFKLFVNRFNLVWKVLLYQLVCVIVLAGISLACCYNLIESLVQTGFFDRVAQFFVDNVFNVRIDLLMTNVSVLINQFFEIISADLSTLLPLVIVLFVIIVFGGTFLFSLADIAITECMYGFMGSCAKLSFTGCLISNLGRSVKYALSKMATVMILDLLIITGLIFSFRLLSIGGIMNYLGPIILLAGLILLLSFRYAFFCCWAPAVVVKNQSIFKALKDNFKSIFKKFKTVWLSQLAIIVILFVINVGVLILTCGVGCLFTIPASILYSCIVNNVLYFQLNGLRYYIDRENIVTPKKVEEQESLNTVKFIV